MRCILAFWLLSMGLADNTYDPVGLGYGVKCADDIRGYGCRFTHKPTEPPEPETTKAPFPVIPVVGGVVGAGVAAAGVGLIAAAVKDQFATTTAPMGVIPT